MSNVRLPAQAGHSGLTRVVGDATRGHRLHSSLAGAACTWGFPLIVDFCRWDYQL